MGNINVSYKQRRGSNEAGAECTAPLDYFEGFIESEFNNVKPLYDGLSEDKKTEFKAIFDGMDVMRDPTTFESWKNENEDDPEGLEAAMDSVVTFLENNS